MEHGQSHKELKGVKKIITGHYHTAQEKDNVLYIGSPIPMDFNNANEMDHGFGILDTDTGEIEYVYYQNIAYISLSAADVLDNDLSDLPPTTSVRVVVDQELTDQQISEIEMKLGALDVRDRKLVFKVNKVTEALREVTDIGDLLSVDQAVIAHLQQMTDIPSISKEVLIDLYNQAKLQEDIS
jgi:DNA repair exonuclease SbcCD nuclease subunit